MTDTTLFSTNWAQEYCDTLDRCVIKPSERAARAQIAAESQRITEEARKQLQAYVDLQEWGE